jgi:hypothetical protein
MVISLINLLLYRQSQIKWCIPDKLVFQENGFSVFGLPNQTGNCEGQYRALMYGLSGQIVYAGNLVLNKGNSVTINTDRLPPGIYTLQLISDENPVNTYTFKLAIK